MQLTTELPPIPAAVPPPAPALDTATLALLDQWLAEDGTDDPVLLAAAERELAEFKAAMNASRAEIGARLLFP